MIEDYPKYFSSKERDVISAFFAHLHALRSSELYLIQERAGELLRFAHHLATDLRLAASDQSRIFEKAFKRRFERRLRKRHRLVHAHERPSLMTRMLDVVSGTKDREALGEALSTLIAQLFVMFESLKEEAADESNEDKLLRMKDEMRKAHVVQYDEETSDMSKLVDEHFGLTFLLSLKASSAENAQNV